MPLNFNFLGNCHNFALALYELTNLPLCILYGEREHEEFSPEGVLQKKIEPILIHVGVVWSGCFFDENGNQGDPGSLMRQFKNHNPDYSFTKIFEMDSPTSEFYLILSKTQASTRPEIISEFKEWILNQKGNQKFPFLELD